MPGVARAWTAKVEGLQKIGIPYPDLIPMMFPYQRLVPGTAWVMASVDPQPLVKVDAVTAATVVAADISEIVVQVDILAAVEQQSVVEPLEQAALHIASHSIPVALAGFALAEMA